MKINLKNQNRQKIGRNSKIKNAESKIRNEDEKEK